MTTKAARLARIESTLKPCGWCRRAIGIHKAFVDALIAQGVTLHTPDPKKQTVQRCKTCGVNKVYDETFVSEKDIKLAKKLGDCLRETVRLNRVGLPPEWWRDFLGIMDRHEAAKREYYGTAYDVAIKQTDYPRTREIFGKLAEAEIEAWAKDLAEQTATPSGSVE